MKSPKNVHLQHIISPYTIPIKIREKMHYTHFKNVELRYKLDKILPKTTHTHTHTVNHILQITFPF